MDEATTKRVGAKGMVVRVRAVDARSKAPVAAKGVRLTVDFSQLADAFGDDTFVDRAAMEVLAACGLLLEVPATCPPGTPLTVTRDRAARTLTASLDEAMTVSAGLTEIGDGVVQEPSSSEEQPSSADEESAATDDAEVGSAPAGSGGDEVVLALSSSPTAATGDYTATKLTSTASWQVGLSAGSFDMTYPIAVPPATAGAAPNIALGYSSASVDNFTSATNAQPSLIGAGWDYQPGYIERQYKACADPAAYGTSCWAGENYTISLNGTSSKLQMASPDAVQWRLSDDPGWRVEHLSGDYFRVTTTDGTQYFFGREWDPTGVFSSLESRLGVPIWSATPGEPCFGQPHGLCYLAWRWMLDAVVDTNNNVTIYKWRKDQNHYNARGLSWSNQWLYDKGAVLEQIKYGMQPGDVTNFTRVVFNSVQRCATGAPCTDFGEYEDTPWDLACWGPGITDRCTQYSPTFWSSFKLGSIQTQVWDFSVGWRAVDTYDLNSYFPLTDGSARKLWFQDIRRTGSVGGTLALPITQFGGVLGWNRHVSNPTVSKMSMYRMSDVWNELGGRTHVEYNVPFEGPFGCAGQPAAGWFANQQYCFPSYVTVDSGDSGWGIFYKYVVKRTEESDYAWSVPRARTYTYHSPPQWHYGDSPVLLENNQTSGNAKNWNDYRGHTSVEVTDPDGLSLYQFFTGMHGDRANNSGGVRSIIRTWLDGRTSPDYNLLAGYQREMLRRDLAGNWLYHESTDYKNVHTTANPAPDQYAAIHRPWEARTTDWGPSHYKQTYVRNEYDGYGNLVAVYDDGDINTAADDRNTAIYYRFNEAAWLVDRPLSRRTRAGLVLDQGAIASWTETFYDDQPWGTNPVRGNPTAVQTVFLEGGNPPPSAYTLTRYDARGRPDKITDGNGHWVATTHNGNYGYPETITNQLGHQVSTVMYPEWGVPKTVTDANGKVTTIEYDPVGRTRKVWKPTEATTGTASVEYTYQEYSRPASTTTYVLQSGSTTVPSRTWVNGFGQPVQTETSAPSGQRRLSSTNYDGKGRPIDAATWVTSGTPWIDYVAPPWGSLPNREYTIYDPRDRPTFMRHYTAGTMMWETTTLYDAWTTTVQPPSGGATTTVNDAHGNTAVVWEYLGAANATPYATTTYSYDAADRLRSVNDGAGHTTTMAYDLAGRKLSMSDPDMGAWTYTYDAVGNLLTQTDAKNQTIWFNYDALNRKTEQRKTNSTGALLAAWSYDPTGYKGLLGSATSYDDAGHSYTQRVTAYDPRNRPTASQWEISAGVGTAAGTYKEAFGYDAADHMTSHTYPANNSGGLGEVVTSEFDGFGRPYKLSSPLQTYVSSTTYNPLGQRTNQSMGAIAATIGYDATTHRITTRTATDGASGLQNLTYGYDNSGNVTSIADGTDGNQKLCFAYDGRQRLTRAVTQDDPCQTFITTRGTSPYDQTFSYDNVGNLTQRRFRTVAGGAYTTTGYTYGDAAHIHAATAVGADTFTYDDNGNQKTRTVGAQEANLTWDYSNQLTQFQKGTATETYAYGPDGARIRRTTTASGSAVAAALIVSNPASPLAEDTALKNRMTSKGYTVNLVDDDAAAPTGIGLIVISPSTSGGSLAAKYKDVAIPVVNMEAANWQSAGLSTANGTANSTSTVYMANTSHPTAAGLSGTVTVTNGAQDVRTVATTTLGTGAQTITKKTSTGPAVEFIYNTGAARPSGVSAAPAKRVALGFHNSAINNLATNGWKLFDAAINWAAPTTPTSTTTLYLGATEITAVGAAAPTIVKYYDLAGQRICLRTATGAVYYIVGDHLGNSSVTYKADGTDTDKQRYLPFGQIRSGGTPLATDRGYGGKTLDSSSGLIQMGARYYDPTIGRFASADTIAPGMGAISLNRYAYANNNPILYTDPTGHINCRGSGLPDGGCDTDNQGRLVPPGQGGGGSGSGSGSGSGASGGSARTPGEQAKVDNAIQDWIDGSNQQMYDAFDNDYIKWCRAQGGRACRGPSVDEQFWNGVRALVFDPGECSEVGAGCGWQILGIAPFGKGARFFKWLGRAGKATRHTGAIGIVEKIGDDLYRSGAGLVFGPGSAEGHRLTHVLAHGIPDSSKPLHTVFVGGTQNVLPAVDEAWLAKGAGVTAGGRTSFVVPMGRTVGTTGETSVKIVVDAGTSNVVTAFPCSFPNC